MDRLTRRQQDVVRLLIEGHPNKVIAYKLGISQNTVKVHMRAILQRSCHTNRVAAAMWAVTTSQEAMG